MKLLKQTTNVRWLLLAGLGSTLIVLGCGAEGDGDNKDAAGGNSVRDAGADTASVNPGAPDTMQPSADAVVVAPDGPPSQDVTAGEAFAAIAGSYDATSANVAGGGSADFDNGTKTTFSITAGGQATFNTKAGALVFDWALHGRTIKRNPASKVTTIEMQGPGKRLISLTAAPGIGLFDVSVVTFEPDGRWYLTAIAKK